MFNIIKYAEDSCFKILSSYIPECHFDNNPIIVSLAHYLLHLLYNFLFSCTETSVYILGVKVNEFSQMEPSCCTNTQVH